MKTSVIFENKPGTWGLRGDPTFWFALKDYFNDIELPENSESLLLLLEDGYETLLGQPLSKEGNVFKKEYESNDHSKGMSSGVISTTFWREKGIPYLMTNFENIKQ